jgi:signal transduction histidine kinase
MNAAAVLVFGTLLGSLGTAAVAGRITMRRRRALSSPLHELRGALAAMQLGLFGLERRGSGLALASRVDALRTQAERAYAAVEDVDDVRLGRHSRGKLESLELGAVVRRRVAAWSQLAEARRRAVELRWPLCAAVVRADEARIGQALDNLIVNALDHGAGLVRVVGVFTGHSVRIAVIDQGSGIARPLSQAMSSPWCGRHGHGLAIAARVAESHGGRLTATSGRIGSRVEIELPLAERGGAGEDKPRAAVPARGLRLEHASSGNPQ